MKRYYCILFVLNLHLLLLAPSLTRANDGLNYDEDFGGFPKYSVPHAISKVNGKVVDLKFHYEITGVRRLHSLGFRGSGVKIAMLENGIHHHHPALQNIGSSPLNADTNPGSAQTHNADTQSEAIKAFHGRGTSMAGIIAGNTKDYFGVAPEAQLTSYNVFGSQGSTSTSTSAVLSALNMAINQGARVITLPEIKTIDASAIELKNLIINAGKKGIVMIVAASDNNYLNNNHFSYTGLPVIPVGGYRTPYQLAHWFEELGTKKRIGFTSTSKGLKENGDKVDIVVFDSVQAIEDLYTKKSAHKMILVMSYTITNANLLRHAKSLNALGVITTRPDTRTRRMIYPVPLFVISKNDAEYIRSRKGQSKFNFTNQRGNILEEELPSLDRLETLDNVSHIPARPDILGPSTNVLAPSNHGTHGYTMFNGVFAAIAYVTGAVALLIQSNVDNTNNYLFVKGSLQNYATPLLFQGIKVPVSVIFQGAGAINVRDTLMNSLAVAPSLLDSNTQERTVKHAVAISSLEIIPNFSFSSASSIYILQHNSQTHLIHPNSGGANTTVTVSPPVPTNQYGLTQFEVTINVAANIPPKSVLRYSGFILIHLTPPLIGQYTRKLICLPYNGKISG